MPGPQDFVFGVLVPAILAGLILLVAWFRRGPAADVGRAAAGDLGRGATGDVGRGRVAGAFALGVAYLAAHAYLFRGFVVPAADRILAARDWIPWVVVAAMLLALVELVPALARGARRVVGPIACALLVWLSLGRQIGGSITLVEAVLALAVLVAAWASAEALARRAPGAGMPLVLWIVATGTSVACLLATTASMAQVAGALAGSLGAAVVLAWWNRHLSLDGGGVLVALVVIGACVINAVFYSTLPRASGLLLLFGLGTPWLALLPWFDALGPKAKALVRAGFAALPVGAALVLAYLAAPEPYEY
jgi:hypothetical protein